MPRLIPRLLKRLKSASEGPSKQFRLVFPDHYRKSPPQFISDPFDFSPHGRTKSILLDPLNPIIHPKRYARHKTLPPRIRTHRNQRNGLASGDGTKMPEVPRGMTASEMEWWANPYCMPPIHIVRFQKIH